MIRSPPHVYTDIPSDARSIRSQATYSSGLPSSLASGNFGSTRSSSYAPSALSQAGHDDDASSLAGSSIAFNQADRISVVDGTDYKSFQDDDVRSQISGVSPITVLPAVSLSVERVFTVLCCYFSGHNLVEPPPSINILL